MTNKYKSYSTDDLRSMMQSGLFFPEPSETGVVIISTTPLIAVIEDGTDEYHKTVRQTINRWLKNWDFAEIRDVIMRLTSGNEQNYESALWELYLNTLFRELGFFVTHEPLSHTGEDKNKVGSPDFLIEKDGIKVLVEAVTISTVPAETEKKLWKELVGYIQKNRRDDFWIGIRPISASTKPPRAKKILADINTKLNSLNPPLEDENGDNDFGVFRICVEDWEIEISAHWMPEGDPIDVFVGLHGNLDSGLITDTSDLLSQVEYKRSKYGKALPHKFVIAVLENSFMGGLDDVHRFGALFGEGVVHFHHDGTSTNGRKPNGLWNNGKKDEHLSGLLLLGGLNVGNEHFALPEFWTNPYMDTSLHELFPFSIWKLEGDTYSKTSRFNFWNQKY